MSYVLHLGDCLTVMSAMQPDSVDAIVTDPPYGLSFMGRDWDHGVPGVPFWEAALRVAKPGAHLLAFGGTRTHHRLMVAIEDAGWEIRDCLMWLYGSGFPKSANVSKLIDKAAGAEREVIGHVDGRGAYDNSQRTPREKYTGNVWNNGEPGGTTLAPITAPASDAAKQWDGWGTALKPAWEPVILARKPLSEATIAANVLRWGTGGLNVDGCRIGTETGLQRPQRNGKGITGGWADYAQEPGMYGTPDGQGRWPANLALDEYAAALLDAQSGTLHTHAGTYRRDPSQAAKDDGLIYGAMQPLSAGTVVSKGDTGGAARFFYCAKASRRDRDEGLEGMPTYEWRRNGGTPSRCAKCGLFAGSQQGNCKCIEPELIEVKSNPVRNHHPTVKSTPLMRWLVRLVTPPGGTVLDPFMGSGSTGKAAMLEGFSFAGIDIEAEYIAIADKRIAHAIAQYVKQQEMAALQPQLWETTP